MFEEYLARKELTYSFCYNVGVDRKEHKMNRRKEEKKPENSSKQQENNEQKSGKKLQSSALQNSATEWREDPILVRKTSSNKGQNYDFSYFSQ